MMDKKGSANYEDRIKFVIALMTKDYVKAYDVGNQLLKRNQKDIDLIRAISILKHKNQREVGGCERSSSIDSSIEPNNKSECEGSNAIDGDDCDFVDDNANICIGPRVENNIAPYDISELNNADFKQKMYRVIPIRVNRKNA